VVVRAIDFPIGDFVVGDAKRARRVDFLPSLLSYVDFDKTYRSGCTSSANNNSANGRSFIEPQKNEDSLSMTARATT